MQQETVRRMLRLAEQRLEEGNALIREQKGVILRLRVVGRDTKQASAFLNELEEIAWQMLDHKELLERLAKQREGRTMSAPAGS